MTFFTKGELNNSYCLKNFNYSLTLVWGVGQQKKSYIRIKIFPCVNSNENNNNCKSPDIIDKIMLNGYFSILIKELA